VPSPRFAASVAVFLALVGALTLSPAAARASGPVTSASPGDVDGDTIPDTIERAVCGSSTCATGTEDVDGDGITDAVEVASCGTTRCADPRADADGDGIPDFVERLVCGSDICTSGPEDTDGDGVPDWVEFVICGTATCATGSEDLDGDGVAVLLTGDGATFLSVKPERAARSASRTVDATRPMKRLIASLLKAWRRTTPTKCTSGSFTDPKQTHKTTILRNHRGQSTRPPR
jgi:hypothetical protein